MQKYHSNTLCNRWDIFQVFWR